MFVDILLYENGFFVYYFLILYAIMNMFYTYLCFISYFIYKWL